MQATPPAFVKTPAKPSAMKRFLKRFLFWSALLFGLIFIGLVLIAALFEKQIGNKVLQEVNKQLSSELKVKTIDLSLISGFPKASVNLRNVELDDAGKGTLLEAKNLAFRFGLFSLFSSKVQLHSVLIQDGALFIHIDKKGKGNYNILKASENGVQKASMEDKEFSLSLAEARLEDVELIFIDERFKQEIKGLVRDALVSGEFSNKQFSMYSFVDMESGFFELDKRRYMAGRDLMLDANLDVDLTEGRYTFKDVDLGIESNIFKVNGSIISKGSNTDFDLSLKSEEGNIAAVISLLPEEQLEYFSDFSSKGTFFFNAAIKGRLNPKENPSIIASLGLKNGKISSEKLGSTLKDVTFNASFNNGKNKTAKSTVFEIKDFKGYFNRELIESNFKISDFDDPTIDFQLDGVLPLASMYGMLGSKSITDGDGELEIKDLKLSGKLKDMQNPGRISRVKSSGTMTFDDASLTINKEEIVIDKGNLVLKNNSLTVEKVKIEGAGSELVLAGKFTNLIPVLFADSLNTKKAELNFEASLDAEYIDFDRLVGLSVVPTEQLKQEQPNDKLVAKGGGSPEKVATNQRRERITKFMKGTFFANIEEFDYNKIKGENFEGSFEFANNQLIISGNALGMDGSFEIEGKAFFNEKPFIKAQVECDGIDIKKFFDQSENFGQKVVLAENLKGKLNARIAVDAYWDESLRFNYDDLNVIGDLNISDGELVGFKLLYEFSDFIKMEDLRHIKFKEMRNWLEIKDKKVYIPAMFLQSNALNMTISGEHSFDNDIDYNIKINAGQVLLNKFKRHNPRLQAQEAKKKGWFNLYYHIYGTVDKYQVKTDKRSVMRNFEYSDRRKMQIQNRLVSIFGEGMDIMDEPSDWKDIPEHPTNSKPDDVEFLEENVDKFELEQKDKPIVKPQKVEEEEFLWEDDGK